MLHNPKVDIGVSGPNADDGTQNAGLAVEVIIAAPPDLTSMPSLGSSLHHSAAPVLFGPPSILISASPSSAPSSAPSPLPPSPSTADDDYSTTQDDVLSGSTAISTPTNVLLNDSAANSSLTIVVSHVDPLSDGNSLSLPSATSNDTDPAMITFASKTMDSDVLLSTNRGIFTLYSNSTLLFNPDDDFDFMGKAIHHLFRHFCAGSVAR